MASGHIKNASRTHEYGKFFALMLYIARDGTRGFRVSPRLEL